MTIAISICTTFYHTVDIIEASSPQDAVLKFLDILEMEDGDLIESVVTNESNGDIQFTEEVEKLLYHAIPEKFLPGYVWVESI